MSKKRGFNCPVCDEIFAKNELEDHVQNHFDNPNKKSIEGKVLCLCLFF